MALPFEQPRDDEGIDFEVNADAPDAKLYDFPRPQGSILDKPTTDADVRADSEAPVTDLDDRRRGSGDGGGPTDLDTPEKSIPFWRKPATWIATGVGAVALTVTVMLSGGDSGPDAEQEVATDGQEQVDDVKDTPPQEDDLVTIPEVDLTTLEFSDAVERTNGRETIYATHKFAPLAGIRGFNDIYAYVDSPREELLKQAVAEAIFDDQRDRIPEIVADLKPEMPGPDATPEEAIKAIDDMREWAYITGDLDAYVKTVGEPSDQTERMFRQIYNLTQPGFSSQSGEMGYYSNTYGSVSISTFSQFTVDHINDDGSFIATGGFAIYSGGTFAFPDPDGASETLKYSEGTYLIDYNDVAKSWQTTFR